MVHIPAVLALGSATALAQLLRVSTPSVWPRPSGGRPPQLIGGSKLGMFNHQKVGFYHDFNMKNGMFTVYKLDLTIKIIKTCDFTMKNADVTIKRLGLKHEK